MQRTAWGIDLGTTNSSIARLVDGKPIAVAIGGSPLVPSVVQYAHDGGVVVGREARNMAILAPERTVRSVKRSMGKPGAGFDAGGARRTPEEVSAEILRELARGARAESGEVVREAVITVPAYFDDSQRKATLQAGQLAELEVLRLLSEPTSASLVYEQLAGRPAAERPENVVIYDLGGGTFDVSVLEVFEGAREVKAIAGDTALGGDDFDDKLVAWFAARLKDEGVQVGDDRRARCRLVRLAEEVKIRLSTDTAVEVREEIPLGDRTVPLSCTVTRRDLEALVGGMLERTIDLAEKAVRDAGLEPKAIDRICLVGGSTRIPLVRSLVERTFPAPVHEDIDPDLCVSLGAAVQAGLLSGARTDRILVDVAAHSLGTSVVHNLGDRLDWNRFATIIPKNSVLPARRAEEFYTMSDRQKRVDVQVFQGEAVEATQNLLVGSFKFPLAPAPACSPVRIEFAYDLNGVVQVSASQPGLDNAKGARFSLSDAGAPKADPAIAARARRLLDTLAGGRRKTLEKALARYQAATDAAARLEAEDALLDLFVQLEGAADAAAPA